MSSQFSIQIQPADLSIDIRPQAGGPLTPGLEWARRPVAASSPMNFHWFTLAAFWFHGHSLRPWPSRRATRQSQTGKLFRAASGLFIHNYTPHSFPMPTLLLPPPWYLRKPITFFAPSIQPYIGHPLSLLFTSHTFSVITILQKINDGLFHLSS